MLISIDHGNKLCKLVHSEPYVSGLAESEVKPFGTNVLEYQGKYYQLSDQRIPYRRDKTEDDRFFLLTLIGIAREIEAQNGWQAGVSHIQLAVGLPPAHYGAQVQAFTRYFSNRGVVSFRYRDKPHLVSIDDVAYFPQSYAAAVTIMRSLTSIPTHSGHRRHDGGLPAHPRRRG